MTNEEKSFSNWKLIQNLIDENAELRKLSEHQKSEIARIVEQSTKELLNLVETKDKFYRIIAHELRNPFNSILGFVSLLLKNLRNYDLEKIEQLLTVVHQSTNISFKLLVSLSEWLGTQNKGLKFEPENANINQLLSEAILSAKLGAEGKNIEINNYISCNVFAFVDKNMISTVFRNLINNAIKFTDKNGKIEISAEETGEFIKISVKDTGVGLSIESINKIFNLENINFSLGTAHETGTGLGLFLCKEFIEIEGGKIWAESIFGHGSEFKFTLPKSK